MPLLAALVPFEPATVLLGPGQEIFRRVPRRVGLRPGRLQGLAVELQGFGEIRLRVEPAAPASLFERGQPVFLGLGTAAALVTGGTLDRSSRFNRVTRVMTLDPLTIGPWVCWLAPANALRALSNAH
jgi:fermentation-respiration switch protein FrsA (DUF1100 family)